MNDRLIYFLRSNEICSNDNNFTFLLKQNDIHNVETFLKCNRSIICIRNIQNRDVCNHIFFDDKDQVFRYFSFFIRRKKELSVIIDEINEYNANYNYFDVENAKIFSIDIENDERFIAEPGPEKKIENEFCEFLKINNKEYKRQVKCEYGIADIVTDNSIFEVKHILHIRVFQQAIFQLLDYQESINLSAHLYVIGKEFKTHRERILKLAKKFNIKIILYDNGKFRYLR